jgi:hypothetical protein
MVILNGKRCHDHQETMRFRDKLLEKTGWIAPGDGLLAMDRNGDGAINSDAEHFGSGTLLSNGAKATDGFQALADLDST